MNQKTEKTNPKLAAFYSLGQIGSDLSWYMINTYLTVFYTDVVGLSAAAISLIMLVARIWDAVNDPLMGTIADRTKTRWGTFRPYLMFAPPFLAVFNILTFTVFPVEGTAKVAICFICYVGAGMAYTAVNICYGGLINRIAKNSQVRMNYITAKSIAASVLSMILSAVVMPTILFFSNTMKDGAKVADAHGYFMTVVICSIILIPCFWLCAWKCKEKVVVQSSVAQTEKKPLGKSLKALFKNKYLVMTVFCVFAGACGAMARMAMLSFYVIYVVGSFTMIAPIYTTMTVCSLLGSFTLPWGTKTFGKRNYLMILTFISIAGLVLMFLVPADNKVFLLSVSAIIGLTMCSGNICTGMLADSIEYGDYKFGVRDEGLTFSFMGFGVKMATAITGAVTVLMLDKVGYVPNADQTEAAKMGINALVNLFPAAVMLISIIPLFFYRLDGKMDEIAAALDERNGVK